MQTATAPVGGLAPATTSLGGLRLQVSSGRSGFCFPGLEEFPPPPFFSTLLPKHIEACLIQCYAMDFHKNSLSVSHTIFF